MRENTQHYLQILPKDACIGERYQVVQCIGVGGFGITYLCEDISLHRKVAVKEYFPRQWAVREESYVTVKESSMVNAFRFGMQSFFQEAEILSELAGTAHVVDFYDIIQDNDTSYLVMKYVDGISIGRILRERGYVPYTSKEAAGFLLPILEALSSMHERGILHRDISPGNIMYSGDEKIYLIDFGAAQFYKKQRLSLNAAFLKPEYAAPEQFRTAREGISKEEGPWTDVYAIGAVLYYLMTGQKPVDAVRRIKGNLFLDKIPNNNLTEEWLRLLREATALKIEERICSAQDLSDRICQLVGMKSGGILV